MNRGLGAAPAGAGEREAKHAQVPVAVPQVPQDVPDVPPRQVDGGEQVRVDPEEVPCAPQGDREGLLQVQIYLEDR